MFSNIIQVSFVISLGDCPSITDYLGMNESVFFNGSL